MYPGRFDKFIEIVYNGREQIIYYAQESWSVINFRSNPKEPDIIWQYLKDGIKYLNDKVAKNLSIKGFTVKFAGVFTHQKPTVKRINNKRINNNCNIQENRCELGDLLTVFLFVDRNKNLLFQKAFISQAKKENKIDNECQRCLYEFDKEFELPMNVCKNINLNKNHLKRKLPELWIRYKGLNYLIIDENSPYIKYLPFNAEVKIPWGYSIFQMLLGTGGLYFPKYIPFNNSYNWSSVIWDLITCTGQAYFKKQRRGNVLNELLNIFNDFDNYDKNLIEIENKDEGGIPILFIIVQDKESNKG